MKRNVLETIMGGVVIALAVFFLVFAYSSSKVGDTKGYLLSGRFSQTNGLQDGAEVRISGVKVGSVKSQELDKQSFLAIVHMSIEPSVRLPIDTIAVVASESLLGNRYVSLQPGGETELLEPGEFFEYTQASPDLETLIGQAIFGVQAGKNNNSSKKPNK